MSINPFSVLRLIEIFLSVILAMQTVEYFSLRRELRADGLLPWSLLRSDFSHWPRWSQTVLGWIYQDKVFEGLLILRFFVCVVVVLLPAIGLVGASLQLGLSLLILWRWRGAFNGGSDFLALLLLLVIWLCHLFPQNATVAKGGLWYISLQVCLSYFISGWTKITKPEWRSGEALRGFLQTSVYDRPSAWTNWMKSLWQFRLVTWLVLIFELMFPMGLFSGKSVFVFLAAGFLFHGINHFIFGLNRFFWVWLAAYPAIYFSSFVFIV